MTRSLAAAVLAAALAAACGDDTPTAPTPITPPTTTAPTVTGVTLQAPAAFVDDGQVLMVGESVTLEACATFSDDTERCEVDATWSSSSPTVATVSGSGVVTGAAPGETTISAVYERNTGRATVTVEAVDEGPWDVSGDVTDAETGQGIRLAVIRVLGGSHEPRRAARRSPVAGPPGKQATTNAQGHYVLTDVAGNMNVSVTADGYRERRTGFNVRMDLEQDFSLEPIPEPDYEIANVSRYDAFIDVSDWLNFTWRALVTADRFEVSVRFQQGAFFLECTERWYGPRAGEQERELVIPSVCGTDEQWSEVTITPADGRTCKGCGTFQRSALPERRSLSLGSADPSEVESFLEEFKQPR